MSNVIEFPARSQGQPEKLKDATAAFTFSRLPREVRIASTLFEILKQLGGPLENGQVENASDLLEISKELAKYSVKDFSVRYGHLNDGKA